MKRKAKEQSARKANAKKSVVGQKKKTAGALKSTKKKSVVLKKKLVQGAAKISLFSSAPEIAIHEMKAEESKYYTGYSAAAAPTYSKSTLAEIEHRELSPRYDEDVAVLQVRDPWWAHMYWDVSAHSMQVLRETYADGLSKSRWVLRAYDVSFIHFNGENAHRYFDTAIDPEARNWYLNLASPGTSWCVDVGFILPDGRFVTVVRSNMICLPLDGPSWVTDEEWMIPEDEFRRLYGMSVGLGPNVSSPVGKLWQERLKKDVSSRGLVSMGVSSPSKQPEQKLPFWLVVDCELIVYGATEPDAKVTVQGRPIELRKDGTFTLRFALPDGIQEIPVVAKSAKINQTRKITPVVTRKTTR